LPEHFARVAELLEMQDLVKYPASKLEDELDWLDVEVVRDNHQGYHSSGYDTVRFYRVRMKLRNRTGLWEVKVELFLIGRRV
jgi:hypothetical protein